LSQFFLDQKDFDKIRDATDFAAAKPEVLTGRRLNPFPFPPSPFLSFRLEV